jgi:hypothetical protein
LFGGEGSLGLGANANLNFAWQGSSVVGVFAGGGSAGLTAGISAEPRVGWWVDSPCNLTGGSWSVELNAPGCGVSVTFDFNARFLGFEIVFPISLEFEASISAGGTVTF